MKLACRNVGGGGSRGYVQMTSADSCRIAEIGGVERVGLVYASTLLRMGCDSLLMPVCGSVGGGEPLWKQNGLPWEHSVENQWRQERQRQKA